MPKGYTSISVKDELAKIIKDLEIELGGVQLSSLDDKLSHLVWFFKHYKNGNK